MPVNVRRPFTESFFFKEKNCSYSQRRAILSVSLLWTRNVTKTCVPGLWLNVMHVVVGLVFVCVSFAQAQYAILPISTLCRSGTVFPITVTNILVYRYNLSDSILPTLK